MWSAGDTAAARVAARAAERSAARRVAQMSAYRTAHATAAAGPPPIANIKSMVGLTKEGGFSEERIAEYDRWMASMPKDRATSPTPLLRPASPPARRRCAFASVKYSTHAPPPARAAAPAAEDPAPASTASRYTSSNSRRKILMGKVASKPVPKIGRQRLTRKVAKARVGRQPRAGEMVAPRKPAASVFSASREFSAPALATHHSAWDAVPRAVEHAAPQQMSPSTEVLERMAKLLAEGVAATPSPAPSPPTAPASRHASPEPTCKRATPPLPPLCEPPQNIIDLTLSDDEAGTGRRPRRDGATGCAAAQHPVRVVSHAALDLTRTGPHSAATRPSHSQLMATTTAGLRTASSPARLRQMTHSNHISAPTSLQRASPRPASLLPAPPSEIRLFGRTIYPCRDAPHRWMPVAAARPGQRGHHSAAVRRTPSGVDAHDASQFSLDAPDTLMATAQPVDAEEEAARGARRALEFPDPQPSVDVPRCGRGGPPAQRPVDPADCGVPDMTSAEFREQLDMMCAASGAAGAAVPGFGRLLRSPIGTLHSGCRYGAGGTGAARSDWR